MLHRATLPTLTLTALVLLAGPADAQFTTSSTYRNLLPAAVPYLEDEGLRKELKLTAEQAKKLSAIHQQWQGQTTSASRGSTTRGQDAARQIDQAFTEALQPEQLKRLKQVLLQDLEKRYGFYRAASYDEVAQALNLTAEQKSQIAGARFDGRTPDVLTADQQKKWKELTGEPYAARLQTAAGAMFGPTTSRFGTGPEMAELTWLRTEPVKRELKLTAEQARQVIAVIDSRDAALRDYLSTPREQRPAKVAEADRGAWDGLAKVLQPEQMKRLRQISAQQEQRSKGDLDFLRSEAVRQQLKVTPAQAEKMDALVKGCRDAMRQAVLSGDPAEKVEEKLTTSQKEARSALLAALSEDQRKGIKDVLGEPFELPPTPERGWGTFTRNPAPAPAPTRGSRPGTFASFTALSGAPLAIEAVQKELKLTAEQLAEAPRLAAMPSGTESTATELARVLNAEQVARLRQIRMQQVAYLGGPACVFRYREAVEAVALTEEQQTKLQPLLDEAIELYMTRTRSADAPLDETTRKNAEKRLAEVLTPEQQKKLAAVSGEPFKGSLAPVANPGAPARPGGFPAPAPAALRGFPLTRSGTELGTGSSLTVSLLSLPDVQKELRLTPEQVRRVPELSDRRSFSSVTTGVAEAELERVLNADQIRRLRQLSLQQMERHAGAGYLLMYRDVLESLRPSEEQVATFQTIFSEATRAYNSRASTGALSAEERKKAQGRLDEVLTAEQRRTLSDALGETFAGELPVQTPARGPTSRGSTRDRGAPAFGPGPGTRVRVPAHTSLRYLTTPDVANDLKLTQDQRRKVLEAADSRNQSLADYGNVPAADRPKKLADADAAVDKALAGILDAKQQTRLKQIALQQREELFLGTGSNAVGISIFNDADIVAELKLSNEQLEKITALVQNAVKVRELIQRQHWGETTPPVAEHHAAALERVRGVLTKEQREKWVEMRGEPFQGTAFGPGGASVP